MARKYNPIWKALKANGHAAIAAHPAVHARIVKAVTIEKNKDDGYKLLMYEKGRKAILSHKADGARIKFFLRIYTLAGTIPVENL